MEWHKRCLNFYWKKISLRYEVVRNSNSKPKSLMGQTGLAFGGEEFGVKSQHMPITLSPNMSTAMWEWQVRTRPPTADALRGRRKDGVNTSDELCPSLCFPRQSGCLLLGGQNPGSDCYFPTLETAVLGAGGSQGREQKWPCKQCPGGSSQGSTAVHKASSEQPFP